jgi:IMP dehydrogenase
MPKLDFNPKDHPDLTYQDAFFMPVNAIEEKVMDRVSDDEAYHLRQLKSLSVNTSAAYRLEAHREYFAEVIRLSLLHNISSGLSRDKVDFSPIDGLGNSTPVVASNMNRVTGKRMAEVMARMGGAAAIPQDKIDDELRKIAEYLQTRTEYPTPISVSPETSVKQLAEIMEKRVTSMAVVVNNDGKFLGIVDQKTIPEAEDKDRTIKRYIRKDSVVTDREGVSAIDALRHMITEHVEFLPVLRSDKTVAGAYTRKEAAYGHRYQPFEGVNGGLAFVPTIGALNNDPLKRLRKVIELGAKGVVFDTANLDQETAAYDHILQARKYIEKEAGRDVTIIAGNVVTRDAVCRAISSGADIVKVGIGPGAMCSTRRETGVGRPQFSAVMDCGEEAQTYGKNIWADGGIVDPRDSALALAYSSQVMLGTILAPTVESATDLYTDDQGRTYAINTGMAARQSSELRTGKKVDDNALVRQTLGHRSEGVQSRVYHKPGMQSAADIVHHMMDGVTSAVTYSGELDMAGFKERAHIGIQMASGYQEGLPK